MDPVIDIHEATWQDLAGLAGARGYEFIPLVADDPAYTTAYSCEMVRLGPADHSLRNHGPGDMLVLTVYDPPRVRK